MAQVTATSASNGSDRHPNSWILDSGASSHMTSDRSIFCSYYPLSEHIPIILGDGKQIYGIATGTIPVKFPNSPSETILTRVLHAPEITVNLMSVNQLGKNGFNVVFDGSTGDIVERSSGTLMGKSHYRQGLYIILFNSVIRQQAHVAISYSGQDIGEELEPTFAIVAAKHRIAKANLNLVHRQLAHLSKDTVARMFKKGSIEGIELIPKKTREKEVCESCIHGKQTRAEIPKSTATRSTKILGRIFSDICEVGELSRENHRYYLTITDDHSRYTRVAFLNKKSDALYALKQLIALMENETGQSVKIFRSDNGGEYTSNDFKSYLKDRGIKQELTLPYTPQEDGVSERKNRTINNLARSAIHDAANHLLLHNSAPLPKFLWPHAIRQAVYVMNRSLTRALHNETTPFEVYYGRKPNLSMI